MSPGTPVNGGVAQGRYDTLGTGQGVWYGKGGVKPCIPQGSWCLGLYHADPPGSLEHPVTPAGFRSCPMHPSPHGLVLGKSDPMFEDITLASTGLSSFLQTESPDEYQTLLDQTVTESVAACASRPVPTVACGTRAHCPGPRHAPSKTAVASRTQPLCIVCTIHSRSDSPLCFGACSGPSSAGHANCTLRDKKPLSHGKPLRGAGLLDGWRYALELNR